MIIDLNRHIEEIRQKIEEEEKGMDFEELELAFQRMLEEEKKQYSKKSKIDWENRTFTNKGKTYTFEELYEIYLKNKQFRGELANLKNFEKYFELASLANQLKKSCEDITNITFLPPAKDSQNASVHIDFLWMFMLDEKADIELITKMLQLSDTFSINGSSFSTVRLSFGIQNMWEKYSYGKSK